MHSSSRQHRLTSALGATVLAACLLGACAGEEAAHEAASVAAEPVEATTTAPKAQLAPDTSRFGCTPPAGTVSEASLWKVRVKPESGWTNLAPWAFWALHMARPEKLVELGTHNGYSYFAFCQAIQALGYNTHAYAVDTWHGDDHAGHYGEDVYNRVNTCNEREYAAFSSLMRMRFDEALENFEDGSVDLLHIDGQHYYEDVKRDFEGWLPKLSNRAVVLFHDVDIHYGTFGVWRYWDELKQRYPNFTFHQGPGLGILGVGKDLPPEASALFAAQGADADCIQRIYSQLGNEAQMHQAPAMCE